MKPFFKTCILTVIFNSISLASDVHSLESEAVNSDTLSKGLARSTFDVEVRHPAIQSEVSKENNIRQHLPHSINFSPYCVHGRVQTSFKLGGATLIKHGFGTLVSPSHVLTAAHNLFKHDFDFSTESGIFTTPIKNKWTYETTFSPFSKISTSGSLTISDSKIKASESLHIQAHTLLCPRLWVEKQDPLSDYGMMILEKPIGDTLGWAGLYSDDNDQRLSNMSEITGTFLDYKQKFDRQLYLTQYESYIMEVTQDEISYLSKSSPLTDELLDWGILFQKTESPGYLVVGFGINKSLGSSNIERSKSNDLYAKKVLRLSPAIFDQLIRWLRGEYPSVDQEIKFKTNKKRAGDPYNDPQAQFYLAEHYRNLPTPKWDKAFEWYMYTMMNKRLDGLYKTQGHEKLGDYYYEIDKDIALSIGHYKSAKTPHSMYMLWKIYKEKGEYDRAQEWYVKITDQTHLEAIEQDPEWRAWQEEQSKKNTQTNIVSGVDFQQTKQDIDKHRLLHQQAEKGSPQAQFNLGLMYHQGKGVNQNFVEAIKWFRAAAEQGFAPAQYNLGVMYNQGESVSENLTEAIKWYRAAAEQGDAQAQFNLGVMYHQEQVVPQDLVEAVKWYRAAADQGDAQAQYNLGNMYDQGQGVNQDLVEAVKWYRAAADQGLAQAQCNLGTMYAQGRSVPQDSVKAIKWFRAAAEQGSVKAKITLGNMYEQGQGVLQNLVEAIKWYKAATELGDAETQLNFDVMYEQDQKINSDLEEVIRCLKFDAEQGYTPAQLDLGVMYDQGRGVNQDFVEAIKWYKMAAADESLIAQFKLGVMYDQGRGVPQDLIEAIKWYKAAAERHYSWVKSALGKMCRRYTDILHKQLKASADQGHAKAQFDLGVMYAEGGNTSQNLSEAVKWFKMAAEQKDAQAQYNLSIMYNQGLGVSQDSVEAIKWLQAAAEQGDAQAQYNLGNKYNQGRGVSQDFVEAVKWHRAAADQGHIKAQFVLGQMYDQGRGVPQDYQQAFKYFELAAHKINDANFNLGVMYYLGQGLEHNDIDQAIKYMTCFLEKEDRQTSEYKVAQAFLSKIQNEVKADSTHTLNSLENVALIHQSSMYNLDEKHWKNVESDGLKYLVGQEIAAFSRTKIGNSSDLLKQLVINHIVKKSPHAQLRIIEQLYDNVLNGD